MHFPRPLSWIATLALGLVACLMSNQAVAAGPFQATGCKVGEVDATSAIVWTRLTRNAQRNPADGPQVTFKMSQRPLSSPG